MLDRKKIRENPEEIEKKLQTKEQGISLKPFLQLDRELRAVKQSKEELRKSRNDLSEEIRMKKSFQEDVSTVIEKVREIGNEISRYEKRQQEIEKKWEVELLSLPNLPSEEVPLSFNVDEGICLKKWGEKPHFSFPFKNHLELNEKLALFDLPRGAKMTGAGWPVYHHWGAHLEWALLNYMLDIHLKNGFTLWMMPYVVKTEMLQCSGQLPKFHNQFFHLKDEKENHFSLLPTSEVGLCALHHGETLSAEQLPLCYVSYTPCFRREAGAAGKNERGLIRTHQFNKVEMFVFCRPEQGEEMLQRMVVSAEEIVQGLGLHYRNMLLVTGDTSFSAAKTIDCEVWLPGQNRYYEVSSLSYCTDFQSRRSQIKMKEKTGLSQFVHTLNGSGLATSRLFVALLENHQREDGSVLIPKALQRYLGGKKILSSSSY